MAATRNSAAPVRGVPLPFLFWLMLTGLYMFVQPYVLKGRSSSAT